MMICEMSDKLKANFKEVLGWEAWVNSLDKVDELTIVSTHAEEMERLVNRKHWIYVFFASLFLDCVSL